jgi:xanthine dehydrogenase small subunit
MAELRSTIRFMLNSDDVEVTDIPATRTVLDFLRLDCKLRGSKEGCAEGDCGACTVLVGRLKGGELKYETINSCITFVGALDGTHVVTVEQLATASPPLHPVQQAMVDFHGSQCGFCTPGFVMSLYGLYLRDGAPSSDEVEKTLQGNLCRCTGYAPIVRAAEAMQSYGSAANDPLITNGAAAAARLRGWQDGRRVEAGEGRARIILPASVDDLAEVYAANPAATIVAGATDVGLWVTKFMRDIGPLIFIGHLDELRTISDDGDAVTFGAGVSYTEAAPVVGAHFPHMAELWNRIAGDQIRNAGTIGGNVANGSPIGDTPPPFIALGAMVNLRQAGERRSVPLEDFFIAYGKQDRKPGEFVESVTVPRLPAGEMFAVYKISKRREEDITSTCGAFRVALDGSIVKSARIAFGGMAATPKRAAAVEAALVGKPWTLATIEAAIPAFAVDYQPLSDMRASAAYRMLASQNLLRRFFLETTGQGERLLRRGAA